MVVVQVGPRALGRGLEEEDAKGATVKKTKCARKENGPKATVQKRSSQKTKPLKSETVKKRNWSGSKISGEELKQRNLSGCKIVRKRNRKTPNIVSKQKRQKAKQSESETMK